jgi:hypothetical protein
VLIAAALVVVAAAVIVLVSLYAGPPLSAADASATAEARQFATAEVARQATAVSVRRTSTASARATGTAAAIARATREVESTATEAARIESTATAEAAASAIAPATQTAQALAYEEERARVEAITRRLDDQASQVFGPSAGTLDHKLDGTPTCLETGLSLSNFIVSARIYNPYSPSQHPWDYGIAFANEGYNTYYSLVVRSSGQYALKLAGEAFYIEFNEATDLLDLSRPGDNTLKLYVNEAVVYVYLNGVYADTIELQNISLGHPSDVTHSPMLCANLDEGSALENPTTRYGDFTVWALP